MQLCPHAVVSSSSRDQYRKYSSWVTDIIAAKVPFFENKVEKLSLYKAVDEIKYRFGSRIVSKAVNTKVQESVNESLTKHRKRKDSLRFHLQQYVRILLEKRKSVSISICIFRY